MPTRPDNRSKTRTPAPPRAARAGVKSADRVGTKVAGAAEKISRVAADIDRVWIYRIAFVAVIVLFLFVFVRMGIHAFGGGKASEIKRLQAAEAAAKGGADPATTPAR